MSEIFSEDTFLGSVGGKVTVKEVFAGMKEPQGGGKGLSGGPKEISLNQVTIRKAKKKGKKALSQKGGGEKKGCPPGLRELLANIGGEGLLRVHGKAVFAAFSSGKNGCREIQQQLQGHGGKELKFKKKKKTPSIPEKQGRYR